MRHFPTNIKHEEAGIQTVHMVAYQKSSGEVETGTWHGEIWLAIAYADLAGWPIMVSGSKAYIYVGGNGR